MNKWDNATFERWIPLYSHSWSYGVYKQYDFELTKLLNSYLYSKGYVYSHLKLDGAVWGDLVKNFLNKDAKDEKLTIKTWSDSYNNFSNWMRLSFLLSICSYFETYLAKAIQETIESDPGIVFGCSHSIDGILLKKNNILIKKIEINQKITACTKGDWNARISNLKELYGFLPESFEKSISDLEKIRKLRNDMGHAFGRDIERSQNYEEIQISQMNVLSVGRFNKFRKLIDTIIKDFDTFIMSNHIGNYEPLLHYHNMYDKIKEQKKGDKLIALKKSLGREVKTLISKDQCRGIIKYYESL